MQNNLDNFLTDLQVFLAKHPYTQEQCDGVILSDSSNDGETITHTLATVDGDYEEIKVTINLIP